jgi:hypothetical protein
MYWEDDVEEDEFVSLVWHPTADAYRAYLLREVEMCKANLDALSTADAPLLHSQQTLDRALLELHQEGKL